MERTYKNLEPGEIVEFQTEAGLRYVQVTHRHPFYPEVVRAIKGFYTKRPELAELGNSATAFSALCPISDILGSGNIDASAIGYAPLPEHATVFPIFRTPIRDRNGDVVYWWFWDGEGLRFDANPGPDTHNWPRREVIGSRELLTRLSQTQS